MNLFVHVVFETDKVGLKFTLLTFYCSGQFTILKVCLILFFLKLQCFIPTKYLKLSWQKNFPNIYDYKYSAYKNQRVLSKSAFSIKSNKNGKEKRGKGY